MKDSQPDCNLKSQLGAVLTVLWLCLICGIICLGLVVSTGIRLSRGPTITEILETDSARYQARLLTATVVTFTPTSLPPHLIQPSPTSTPTEFPLQYTLVDKTVYITATSLPVWSGPGIFYDSEGFLAFGDSAEVQGERDGWYLIEFEDGVAWISAAYTSEEQPGTSPSPVSVP